MKVKVLLAVAISLTVVSFSNASFIVQPDADGSTDGAITFNSNFSFGNGGTTASVSSTPTGGTAIGLEPGDAIFGGNGSPGDQYIYTYTPGVDADNAVIAPGTDLGDGNTASGLTGGASGTYNVYATWPTSSNISNDQATNYVATSDDTAPNVDILQDTTVNGGVGNVWVLIGTVQLTAGSAYTVTQTAPDSSFVSMRSAGVMWELIPEPSSIMLLCLGAFGLASRSLRR